MPESDEPIESAKKRVVSSRPKGRLSLSSSRIDRDLLIAQYRVWFSARENVRLTCRTLFAALTFAAFFVKISTLDQLLGTGALGILLAMVWYIDDVNRGRALSYLERELVNRLSESLRESDADDYIRSRYYGSKSLVRGFGRVEPFVWATRMFGAALLNAGPTVLKHL